MKVESNSPLINPPSDYCPPGSAKWLELPKGPDRGKRLFYYDHTFGDSEPKATILFVHGNPETSYTYRRIRDCLADSGESLRIVAMDHIGFGLSDQATYEMVDMHHAKNLAMLVEHLDLQDITLVIHDWGGPIGIGAFIGSHQRVSALVLMNTTVFPMPADGWTYTNFPTPRFPWSSLPDRVPDAMWGGIAGYVVSGRVSRNPVRMILQAAALLLRHALGLVAPGSPEYVWSTQFRSIANTRSSKRMVRQTPVWGHGYQYEDPNQGEQSNKSFYKQIQTGITGWWGPGGSNIPAVAFFGKFDPCGKESVARQWLEALPQLEGETHVFPKESHFIEEHKGPEIAEAILRIHGLDQHGVNDREV